MKIGSSGWFCRHPTPQLYPKYYSSRTFDEGEPAGAYRKYYFFVSEGRTKSIWLIFQIMLGALSGQLFVLKLKDLQEHAAVQT